MVNLCLCGCGAEVKNRYVRGHRWRKPVIEIGSAALADDLGQIEDVSTKVPGDVVTYGLPMSLTPPPWPASIDRSRWRLAEDRPGTDVRNPWIETKCHSCLQTMWARDPLSTWERGGCCEECGWIAREDFGKEIVKRNSGPYDPFV